MNPSLRNTVEIVQQNVEHFFVKKNTHLHPIGINRLKTIRRGLEKNLKLSHPQLAEIYRKLVIIKKNIVFMFSCFRPCRSFYIFLKNLVTLVGPLGLPSPPPPQKKTKKQKNIYESFFKPPLSEDILTEELRDNLKGYSHVGVKINLF